MPFLGEQSYIVNDDFRFRSANDSFLSTNSQSYAKWNTSKSGMASPGRFIPSRKSLNIDLAHFKVNAPAVLQHPVSDDIFEDEVIDLVKITGKGLKYQNRMTCMSEGAFRDKIFKFNTFRKSRAESFVSESRFLSNYDSTFRKRTRNVAKHPERVLDLPNLDDNFFSHTVAWSSKGVLVAALMNDLHICRLKEKRNKRLHSIKDTYYASVAFDPTGTFLACGTHKGEIQLWDMNVEKMISSQVHQHKRGIEHYWDENACRLGCLDWSPNKSVLSSGCRSGHIDHWDTRCFGKSVENINSAHTYSICNIKYSAWGNYLSSGDSCAGLKVWDANSWKTPCFQNFTHTSAIRALAWYPLKNSILASGGGIDDGYIRFWNVHTGKQIGGKFLHSQICCLLFSPLTNELISSQSKTNRHQVTVWKYPSMEKVASLRGHAGRVLHMSLSPCQKILATASGDEMLRIWRIANPGHNKSTSSTSSVFTCIR